MIPELYTATSDENRSLIFNYLGKFKYCTSCKVTEKRNDDYSLVLTLAKDDELANKINTNCAIKALANPQDDPQYFVVYKIERVLNGKITVYAKHIRDILFQIFLKIDSMSHTNGYGGYIEGTPPQIWAQLNGDTEFPTEFLWPAPFSMKSNFISRNKLKWPLNKPLTVGDILFKIDGSLKDIFPTCDFKWDNFTIYFQPMGRDTGYSITYGKNISSATQTESNEDVYTHIQPYAVVNNALYNGKLNIKGTLITLNNNTSYYKSMVLDCSEATKGMSVDTEVGTGYSDTIKAIDAYAQNYLARNDLTSVTVNITVDVRAALDELKDVGLCDTVHVILDDFGTKTSATINEVVFDTLLERWDKLQIGQVTKKLSDVLIGR